MNGKYSSISPIFFTDFSNQLEKLQVKTICDSALCINRPECYKKKTITFLIMGDICTRNCQYCSVNKGIPSKLDKNEPQKISNAIKKLQLKYVVLTSVTRDDIRDQGANHFINIINEIKKDHPNVMIEILIPDFWGKKELLSSIVNSQPNVINHNIECTKNRFKILRPRGNYRISLKTLRLIKKIDPSMTTKSGFMVGVGETINEIKKTIVDLKNNLVDIITIGQYMTPSKDSFPLLRKYNNKEFKEIRKFAESLNCFKTIFIGSNVRSSYHADKQLNN